MVSLALVRGDITQQEVDAVVNAANSSLMGGGGVDGAIHRRGGPEILAECRQLRDSQFPEGLPTGQAVATTAGLLPARWVIHTVGPVWSADDDRSAQLASCYRESLRVADELGARTVAFPAISTGIYGWPIETAPGSPSKPCGPRIPGCPRFASSSSTRPPTRPSTLACSGRYPARTVRNPPDAESTWVSNR